MTARDGLGFEAEYFTGLLVLKTTKRIIRLIIGWGFIGLGLLGLLLPVLQGILFLCIGMILLAPDVPLFRRVLDKLRGRYPGIASKADSLIKKIAD